MTFALQHFSRIALAPAEADAAREQARKLRDEHGDAGARKALALRVRTDLTAYQSVNLSLSPANRAALAKRIRGHQLALNTLGELVDAAQEAEAPPGVTMTPRPDGGNDVTGKPEQPSIDNPLTGLEGDLHELGESAFQGLDKLDAVLRHRPDAAGKVLEAVRGIRELTGAEVKKALGERFKLLAKQVARDKGRETLQSAEFLAIKREFGAALAKLSEYQRNLAGAVEVRAEWCQRHRQAPPEGYGASIGGILTNYWAQLRDSARRIREAVEGQHSDCAVTTRALSLAQPTAPSKRPPRRRGMLRVVERLADAMSSYFTSRPDTNIVVQVPEPVPYDMVPERDETGVIVRTRHVPVTGTGVKS